MHGGDRVRCDIDGGIAHIVIDTPGAKVNTIDLPFIAELEGVVADLPPDLRGIVLSSGKPEQFVAGADLTQLSQAERPEEASAPVRRLQRALNRLAEHPAPSVAALAGPALGGGLELALACDYRVCVEHDGSILGLPEVTLGLVPAGGGCQRLPRLIGLTRALGLILQGRRYSPRRARRYGVVDEVVHPMVLTAAAESWLGRGKRRDHPRWTVLDRAAERSAPLRAIIYLRAARDIRRETRGHYPAPVCALDAVRAGLEQGQGAGLAAEAVAFGELATGPVAHALIGLFLATEALKREQRPAEAHRPHTVGVVGAGFMGAGIAQAVAVSGATVRLRDLTPAAVAKGIKTARDLTASAARKGRFTRSQAAAIVGRISGTTEYAGFGRAQLAVEAVFEDLAVKRSVIAELEAVLPEEAAIASNTSALPIADLAAGARHPERIAGMHFFSPVHRMPLIEVIRADRTSDATVATAIAAGRALGKTVITVRDGPGFYTTRVLALMLQEAGRLFEAGAAVEEIDGAMTAFGFPVGPLALTDEVGIDVAAHIAAGLAERFPERFAASRAVATLLAEGRQGRKNGRGFYLYGRGKKRPDPLVYRLRAAASTVFPRDLIQRRLTLASIDEAARCLEEGILASPRDGDVGAVLGFGFPAYLGGPFRHADATGIPALVRQLEQMEHAYGAPFAPAPLLRTMAASGRTFYRGPAAGVAHTKEVRPA